MQPESVDRRAFLHTTAASAAAASLLAADAVAQPRAEGQEQLALKGGKPVRTTPFASWPMIKANDETAWMKVLKDRHWCRIGGSQATSFEKAYAEKMGSKHCTATMNGTSALFASLNALGVGPGDEVIVPPYTFVATINVVLLQYALPVFVDTDRETSQIDAKKVEAAITPRTRCIVPVHLGGNVADMDALLALGKKHSIPVLEDACQSHLAEWRGRKVGSLGKGGCFSFQVSKNLSGGEGGAILSDDADFTDRCNAFQNNGRGKRRSSAAGFATGGANLRMTEFQATLLLTQMTRLEEQSRTREENARYLTRQLQEIPGIQPAKMYEGCTRNAYHLYMFRYDPKGFAGAPRATFLKALQAEGIPCSSGYTPLNKEPFLADTMVSRAYKAIFPAERLQSWLKNNECPENDKLCGEAVWFTQNMLLGPRSDMDQIAEAIRKIQQQAKALAG